MRTSLDTILVFPWRERAEIDDFIVSYGYIPRGNVDMKRALFICQFLLIVSGVAVAQELTFQRPEVVGRWKVVESWDMTLGDRVEIARTDVLQGFDTIWVFKENGELHMIDPLHMVDPVRQTYLYHWRWLNDTTLCVIPGSKNLYLLCHLLDYSPSRLVFISSVSEKDSNDGSPSLCVLRVLKRTE
jgi:hypothetical protein